MAWNTGLTGKALSIAATDASPLRVLAGPGTGKSYAMMRRVARLLEEGVPGSAILAVTFTRTAASDLTREVGKLGVAGCEDVRAGTLHSFCFRTLQQTSVLEQTGRHPRPLVSFQDKQVLQFEAKPMLADLDSKFGDLRAKSRRVLAFEAAWARQQQHTPGEPLTALDQEFHDALIAWLIEHEAMLIGEVVPQALAYARTNPAAPIRSAYRHIVVDEYQDLNRAEQDLIDLIAEQGKLSVVGDEDQSIYRFRHANPDGIRDFNIRHTSTQDETLDECRRCPRLVVAMADHLIRKNHPPRTAERLRPMSSRDEGEIRIVQWQDLNAEIAGLASLVRHLVQQRGLAMADILVLSPRRYVGYALRDAIQGHGIASHSFYNEEALDSAEAQEAFALLTLLANPTDRTAYRFWLGFGSNDWRRGQYAALAARARADRRAPRDVMNDVVAGALALPGVDKLKKRHALLGEALAPLGGLVGDALVDAVFPAEAWSEILRKAWQAAKVADAEAPAVLDLLRSHVTHPEVPEGDMVRIMSLHKSKGLTSKAVIVTTCVQGLIPVLGDDETLREQRRLFYVALTRATDVLVLSSCLQVERALAFSLGMRVRGWAPQVTFTASRFLSELGPSAPRAIAGSTWASDSFK